MTNTIADFEKADVILLTGSNVTENHPIISTYIKRAVKFKGTKLIVVDPRKIKIADFAHKYLGPNLGTDVVWINGLIHVIIKEKLHNTKFISDRTENFEVLEKAVEKFTPEYVEKITGIAADDIIESARIYANAEKASIAYCMGITQHTTGTDCVKSLANLAMVTGHIGREGTGVNPLRGQNNVQGACDMGGLPNVFTGYQPVSNPDVISKMEKAWGVEGLSAKDGLKNTEMVPAALDKTIRALYVIGENPLVSDPDLNHAEACFKNLDFLVVQDIFLNDTAKLADVVLPAKCFAEKDGTFTNTDRNVQLIRKAVDAPEGAKDDWKILTEISQKMGYQMDYESSEAVFKEISQVTPSYAGITHDRLRSQAIPWPCPDESHPGTPILHTQQFTRGKGLFFGIDYKEPAEMTDKEYPMYLTTGRILFQYHTRTMTGKTKDLNDTFPECFMEIRQGDAKQYGLENGGMARIKSRRGEIEVKVKVTHRIAKGTIFLPFHFAEAAANRLTNAALDPTCKIPEFKVCAVKIEAL